ncbi:molybdopterin oxidoreductase [Novimethylophilus kurashikiensis]|uniref:Molybdopterin oxidoreductase n=1 Tax=Novimethylophilus kurashikiensis TaxID=1825523 RepID=A0A2R5F879_9PROT|nr:hypothetical protein [Novimethylophilus kurashikiensis]GBG14426.1 molybdopterin oxidoreductase [Novimethylophilus kurashikiensis]
MNEYLTYIAIGVGILFLSLLVPGLKMVAEGIIKAGVDFIIEIMKHKATFLIWGIKTLVGDHARVLQHAFQSQDTLDPTQRVRRAAEGYDE